MTGKIPDYRDDATAAAAGLIAALFGLAFVFVLWVVEEISGTTAVVIVIAIAAAIIALARKLWRG
jgi:hypothetical protein